MKDDFLIDGTTSGYRRPREEVSELPKPTVPARLFRRRTGREHPDCMTDVENDKDILTPRSR